MICIASAFRASAARLIKAVSDGSRWTGTVSFTPLRQITAGKLKQEFRS